MDVCDDGKGTEARSPPMAMLHVYDTSQEHWLYRVTLEHTGVWVCGNRDDKDADVSHQNIRLRNAILSVGPPGSELHV